MKKTEVFEGYVGKSEIMKDDIAHFFNEYLILDMRMYSSKGKKSEWEISDWPPKKARLTITIETGKDLK